MAIWHTLDNDLLLCCLLSVFNALTIAQRYDTSSEQAYQLETEEHYATKIIVSQFPNLVYP